MPATAPTASEPGVDELLGRRDELARCEPIALEREVDEDLLDGDLPGDRRGHGPVCSGEPAPPITPRSSAARSLRQAC